MTRTDAVTKLEEDHERVRDLVTQLDDATKAGDAAGASELAHEITNELNVHAAVEEEVFYPAVLDIAPDLAPKVEEALEDHTAAKGLLYEAASHEQSTTRIEGEEPLPEAVLVTEAVHRHMASEHDLFEEVRAATDDAELAEISRSVDAKREQLQAPPLEEHSDQSSAGRKRSSPKKTVDAAAQQEQGVRSDAARNTWVRQV